MKNRFNFVFFLSLVTCLFTLFILSGCSNKSPESTESTNDILLTSTTLPEDGANERDTKERLDSFSMDSDPTTVKEIAALFPDPKKSEKGTYNQTVESSTKAVTTKATPQVVDTWDSTLNVYSLLDDGTVLRGKTPIKNDANYALNTSFRMILFWLENNEGKIPEEVVDEAMVYLADSTAIMIFDGKLKREDAHIYVDNARVAFVKKLEELGYSRNVID